MGHKEIDGRNNTVAAEAIMNNYLHQMATRFKVWRRLLHLCIEVNGIWVTETPKARQAAEYQLKHTDIQVLTPAALAKQASVNRPQIVFCPVRPITLRDHYIDALLDADELHIIRSHDYAQKRFFEEVGQRVAARGSPCKTITYRDGG